MRASLTRLLSQLGFGVNNDLLAAVIVLLGLCASLAVCSLVGAL